MALAYNDGGIKFVQQTITAKDNTGTVTTYIVKKGSVKAGAERIVQKDQFGNEIQQAGMSKIRSGSVDLQFILPADKPPERFQVITLLGTSGVAYNMSIFEVDEDVAADSAADCKLTIYETQNLTPQAG
jgi:hypothetical protein